MESTANLLPTNCRLIQGDATKRETLDGGSVDLTVTSPPYNVGMAYDGTEEGDSISYEAYLDFTRRWLANVFYWTKPTGRLCVNVSLDKNRNGKQPLSADVTRLAMDVGWKYHATIIWNEGNISKRTAWGSWKSASAPHIIAPVETIIVLNTRASGSGSGRGPATSPAMTSRTGYSVSGNSMASRRSA